MASAERKRQPALGRKDTFQKMLDLEKLNKINRMRASSPFPQVTSTPKSPPPPMSDMGQHPPLPLLSIDRSVMASTLSLTMPPAKFAIPAHSPKYVIMPGGDLLPQDDELSEPESAISSICQSPSWEDYNGKRRKKAKEEERERRRREIEATNLRAKQVQSPESTISQPKRLSKPPPANRRLSKVTIPTERSVSAPAVPTLPTMARGDVKKEIKKTPSDKAKRNSLEAGFRGLMSATQAVHGPWKSSQNSSPSNHSTPGMSPARHSFSSKPTYNDGGFVGGVKLDHMRQTGTTTTQVNMHEHKKVGWSDRGPEALNERDPTPRPTGNSSSSTSMAESLRPISLYDEMIQSPRDWDTISAQNTTATRSLASPTKNLEESTPIMEREARRNRPSHPPTSRYFPDENEELGSSQRDSSNGSRHTSLSRSRNTEKRRSYHIPTLSTVSSQPATSDCESTHDRGRAAVQSTSDRKSRKLEGPAGNAAAPVKMSYPPEARGRADFDRFQQRERESSSATTSRDASADSTAAGKKTKSRRGSFSSLFSRSQSRTRASSETSVASSPAPSMSSPPTKKDAPRTTSFSTIGSKSKPPKCDVDPTSPYLDEEYVLNQLHRELTTKAAVPGQKRTSSKGPFQGLKSVAKFAFARHSIASPMSPTGSFPTALEVQGSKRSWSSDRTSLDFASPQISSVMKAETGALASEASSSAREFTLPEVPSGPSVRSSARRNTDLQRNSRDPTPKAFDRRRSNYSRSATDSSEEDSTLDESSNTTPNASRPQSQKDYFSVRGDVSPVSPVNDSSSTLQSPQGLGLTVVTLVDETTSSGNSWCEPGVESERKEDEDHLTTPTGNSPTFDSNTFHLNNSSPQVPQGPLTPPADDSDPRRRPSFSRSMSTPELQDLSFLPTLKHQALTRHTKRLSRPASLKVSPKETAKKAEEALNALVRPPTTPMPNTKSEGSSPTAPKSSQHLQNARLFLPGARSPSHSNRGLHNPSSKITFQPGPPRKNSTEPLAKVFVICCKCKYFQDMPSKVYERMTKQDNVATGSYLGIGNLVDTSVKCPWCTHGMSTTCCEGYAAVVYLNEKLHGGGPAEIGAR
ncbi:uncharacterized protein RCO7_05897 [Rhynchosporium graminicola]|uniref:Uncharacterized protein n=1 Tax=Rhynchosporium graminicola TaxID=2792576 RepID=A0A1E1KAG0_9HELO|nr:uncharacterized protein RCO7_05897 [Rhynchosporium commune]